MAQQLGENGVRRSKKSETTRGVNDVPDDIAEFLGRYIDSIAQLEALLLVRRQPDASWTVGSIARRLYVSESDATAVLDTLCSDGLLTLQKGIYRFAATTDERKAQVDRVDEFYSRHIIPVTNLIHAKPRRLREFSDAFKFRKDRQ